ncbi:MAG TPA: amidohydrolase/deacetylase family metallohydrolase, partial [Nitrosopumilaceae archaeon]|nr:amidohydrolase/deacetylase family metallohydrolase [Nitrosopumilaceae archaeon]
HTHDFYGPDPERHFCNGSESLLPDSFAFRSGVTTVVDAGSSGWKDFPDFKKKIIDSSKTRVLAFLNIVGAGMRGRSYEQDTNDMDAKKTAMVAQQYRDYIVGIKLAHYKGPEWKPVDEAILAGNLANIPLMIDFGENTSPLSLEELFLKHIRHGDIFTHCFAELKGREYIVDTGTKKLKNFVWEAKKKGILYDVGYGEISFSFSQAIPAIESGFYPNSISTDMHAARKNKMKDMLELMSEFLALGMNIREVIERVTWNPAKEITRKELGNLSKGAIADIAILHVRNNNIVFYDHAGHTLAGTKKFVCEMTIRGGKIVYNKRSTL